MRKHNSTLSFKLKPCVRCNVPSVIFSHGRCVDCARIEGSLKRISEQDEKEYNLSELVAECDALFSKYIRLKYADKNGLVKCYTCENIFKVSAIQNGHYISRYNMFLRFDERNCRPQCEYCNCHKRGNLLIFGKNLEAEQNGVTEILYEESKIIYKYSREELKQLIIDLTSKITKTNTTNGNTIA